MTAPIEELARTGVLIYPPKGHSMLPLLREERDLMVIQKGTGEYRKYDAVLFQRNDGELVLHRVLRIEPERCRIQGDNTFYSELVRKEQILGKLTQILRNGKIISTSDKKYRLFVRLWWAVYPLRRLAARLRGCIGRIRRLR